MKLVSSRLTAAGEQDTQQQTGTADEEYLLPCAIQYTSNTVAVHVHRREHAGMLTLQQPPIALHCSTRSDGGTANAADCMLWVSTSTVPLPLQMPPWGPTRVASLGGRAVTIIGRSLEVQ